MTNYCIRIALARGILLIALSVSQVEITTAAQVDSNSAATIPPDTGRGYRVFVTNEGSGDLSVIDGPSGSMIATWPLGKRPRGIAASPDGRHLYVALSGSPVAGPGVDENLLPSADKAADGIAVIDTADGKLERVIHGISDPEQLAVGRDGARLYVASEDTGKAVILDAKTGRTLAMLDVGAEPEGVAVSPDGSLVFVTSEVGNSVSRIDTKSNHESGRVLVGERPRDIAFTSDGLKAYVTGESDGSLVVIDVAALKVDKRIKVPGEHPRPKGVVVSGDNRHVYITTGRAGNLDAFDAVSLELIGSIAVGARPWGLALSPDGRLAYTANGPSNDVSVVDTSTMKVVGKIPVGVRPWGLIVVR